MTMRTSFCGTTSVARQDAQPRVAPASRPAEPHRQRRQDEGFQVPHSGDEREQPDDECGDNEESGGCDPRAAAGQSASCKRTGAEGSSEASCSGANRFLDIRQGEADSDTSGGRSRKSQ